MGDRKMKDRPSRQRGFLSCSCPSYSCPPGPRSEDRTLQTEPRSQRPTRSTLSHGAGECWVMECSIAAISLPTIPLPPVWNILFRNAWFPLRPSLRRARAASARHAEVSPYAAVGRVDGAHRHHFRRDSCARRSDPPMRFREPANRCMSQRFEARETRRKTAACESREAVLRCPAFTGCFRGSARGVGDRRTTGPRRSPPQNAPRPAVAGVRRPTGGGGCGLCP